MSFETSVLFCVLYFFTVAWSIGLNKNQIGKLLALHNSYDRETIPNTAIINYLREVEYTGDLEQFEKGDLEQLGKKPCLLVLLTKPKEFVVNVRTMPEFLILLADNNKRTDCWKEEGLTTYEVKLFVRMFGIQDKKGVKDGHLNISEINDLFDTQLNQTDEIYKLRVMSEFKEGEPINALMFLAAILEKKSKHQHLDEAQINKCQDLYKIPEHLDSKKQKTLFKTLQIVPKKYNNLLNFLHVRSAALELQELLVFWSEHHTDYDINAPLITKVREYMWEFSTYDLNHDGLLDVYELEEARFHTPDNDMNTFFTDKSIMMSSAMFLSMKLALHPEYYSTPD